MLKDKLLTDNIYQKYLKVEKNLSNNKKSISKNVEIQISLIFLVPVN